MSDPVALNQGEQALIPAHKAHTRFARLISNIFSPAPIALPLIVLVAFHNTQSSVLRTLGYAGLTFLFLALGPFVYILIGVLQGKFTDIDVSVRSQRTGPFLFTIISSILGLGACWLIDAPRYLETLIITMILTCILLMITTLWWKISIHTTALGSTATFLTAMYGLYMLPIFLLLFLVGWSRVALQRHTVAQVIGGSIASISITIIAVTLGGF